MIGSITYLFVPEYILAGKHTTLNCMMTTHITRKEKRKDIIDYQLLLQHFTGGYALRSIRQKLEFNVPLLCAVASIEQSRC